MRRTSRLFNDFQIRARWLLLVLSWAAINVAAYLVVTASSTGWKHRQDVGLRDDTLQFYRDASELTELAQKDFRLHGGFRLMRPRIEPSVNRYPLLVFLHGAGNCGDENLKQLLGFPEQMAEPDWRNRFPCFVLAPQRSESMPWEVWLEEVEQLVVLVAEEFPVDKQRVYLTGLSMGGAGAWRLAARRPDLFAAVVPICGAGDVATAAVLKDVPVWAVHGDADEVVPVSCSREMIDAIRAAGGQPHYTELPGVRHDSWSATYQKPDGVVMWMFEQTNRRAVQALSSTNQE